MTTVLPFRPDEKAVLEPDLLGLGMLDETEAGAGTGAGAGTETETGAGAG